MHTQPVDRGALAASAYFASNAQGFAERAFRIGALALGAGLWLVPGSSSQAVDEPPLRPTPQARCNDASWPETSIQGRVPQSAGELTPAGGELALVFESPSRDVLNMPDNVTVSPRGGIVLCEDGEGTNYVRGITRDGAVFDLVRSVKEPGAFNSGKPGTYALGLQIGRYKGVREVGHSGSTAGYRAHLNRFPESRTSVAVLCNSSSDVTCISS